MAVYLIKRLLLMIPTFLAIITINFFIVQLAPGGPVDQYIANLTEFGDVNVLQDRLTGNTEDVYMVTDSRIQDAYTVYQGAGGLSEEDIAEIEKRFGFDKPLLERYFIMLGNYVTFNFGESLFRGNTVLGLIYDRLPVSISLGLWATLITYLVSIPLGIKKAMNHGTSFDIWTTNIVLVTYSIPGFIFAVLLIVLFAGGNYYDWFPLRGLISNNWDELTLWGKIVDYFWHMTLPIIASVIGSFAALTLLTKNLFLEEIHKQYVVTARAKGLSENSVLYKHVFRNAMLLIIAGIPSTLLGVVFGSSLLIEMIFSLDGLGLLFYETTVQRDYPVIFATLYIFTLMGLILNIVGDFMYTLVDPRIDFESR